jgi:deoxycytidylate deaminase
MEKENKLQLQRAYLGIKNEDALIETIAKQAILKSFESIKKEAEQNQICKRKAVGCAILEIDKKEQLITHFTAINGPSGKHNKCKNIKGACGCSHAEPRAIMKYLKKCKRNGHRGKTILLTTFSSCVNCANIIIDSGVIDVVAYEILAEHWSEEPNNAKAMLDGSLPHWTKKQIEEDLNNELISNWLNK